MEILQSIQYFCNVRKTTVLPILLKASLKLFLHKEASLCLQVKYTTFNCFLISRGILYYHAARVPFSVSIFYRSKLLFFYYPGVFCLIQAYSFMKYLRDHMTKSEFKYLFNFAIIGFAGLVFLSVVALTYLGMQMNNLVISVRLLFDTL